MAFPFIKALAAYIAVFPGMVMSPDNAVPLDLAGYPIEDEAFTVPASPDSDGRYRLHLDQVPLDMPSTTIEVDEQARTIIPYGEAPAAGQVALSFDSSVMEFHESDAGLSGVANYTGKGTPDAAYFLIKLGKELTAVQTYALSLADDIITGPGTTTDKALATWNGTAGDELRNNPLATVNSTTGVITAPNLIASSLTGGATGLATVSPGGTLGRVELPLTSAELPTTVAYLNGTNEWTGSNTFTAGLTVQNNEATFTLTQAENDTLGSSVTAANGFGISDATSDAVVRIFGAGVARVSSLNFRRWSFTGRTPSGSTGFYDLRMPEASGTLTVSASAPLALDATTGAMSLDTTAAITWTGVHEFDSGAHSDETLWLDYAVPGPHVYIPTVIASNTDDGDGDNAFMIDNDGGCMSFLQVHAPAGTKFTGARARIYAKDGSGNTGWWQLQSRDEGATGLSWTVEASGLWTTSSANTWTNASSGAIGPVTTTAGKSYRLAFGWNGTGGDQMRVSSVGLQTSRRRL